MTRAISTLIVPLLLPIAFAVVPAKAVDHEAQRIELAEWYGGLKTDSGAARNKLEREFSKAFDDLDRGSEQALRQFDAETGSEDAS